MRKFIIREDTIKEVRETLEIYIEHLEEDCDEKRKRLGAQWIKKVLHEFDTGLCTLSPYMPSHLDLGNEDCCGIFMGIAKDNRVICNECRMNINDAIKELTKVECEICHGEGSTTDHHDPCSNCDGKGYIE